MTKETFSAQLADWWVHQLCMMERKGDLNSRSINAARSTLTQEQLQKFRNALIGLLIAELAKCEAIYKADPTHELYPISLFVDSGPKNLLLNAACTAEFSSHMINCGFPQNMNMYIAPIRLQAEISKNGEKYRELAKDPQCLRRDYTALSNNDLLNIHKCYQIILTLEAENKPLFIKFYLRCFLNEMEQSKNYLMRTSLNVNTTALSLAKTLSAFSEVELRSLRWQNLLNAEMNPYPLIQSVILSSLLESGMLPSGYGLVPPVIASSQYASAPKGMTAGLFESLVEKLCNPSCPPSYSNSITALPF